MPKKSYLLDLIDSLTQEDQKGFSRSLKSVSEVLCSERAKNLTDEEYCEFFQIISLDSKYGKNKVFQILSLYGNENFNSLSEKEQQFIVNSIKQANNLGPIEYINEMVGDSTSFDNPNFMKYVSILANSSSVCGAYSVYSISRLTNCSCDEAKKLRFAEISSLIKNKEFEDALYLLEEEHVVESPIAFDLFEMVTQTSKDDNIENAVDFIKRSLDKRFAEKDTFRIPREKDLALLERIKLITKMILGAEGEEQSKAVVNFLSGLDFLYSGLEQDIVIESVRRIASEEDSEKAKDLKRINRQINFKNFAKFPDKILKIIELFFSMNDINERRWALDIINDSELLASEITIPLLEIMSKASIENQVYGISRVVKNKKIRESGETLTIAQKVGTAPTDFKSKYCCAIACNSNIQDMKTINNLIFIILSVEIESKPKKDCFARMLEDEELLSLSPEVVESAFRKMALAEEGKEYATYIDILATTTNTESAKVSVYDLLQKDPEYAILCIKKSRVEFIGPNTKVKAIIKKHKPNENEKDKD